MLPARGPRLPRKRRSSIHTEIRSLEHVLFVLEASTRWNSIGDYALVSQPTSYSFVLSLPPVTSHCCYHLLLTYLLVFTAYSLPTTPLKGSLDIRPYSMQRIFTIPSSISAGGEGTARQEPVIAANPFSLYIKGVCVDRSLVEISRQFRFTQ